MIHAHSCRQAFESPVVGHPDHRHFLAGDLHLVASSSADNTDWIAKLSDVAPDGSETLITDGYLRASYRKLDRARTTSDLPWHTDTTPTPIDPGALYDYDIAIWPTALPN